MLYTKSIYNIQCKSKFYFCFEYKSCKSQILHTDINGPIIIKTIYVVVFFVTLSKEVTANFENK